MTRARHANRTARFATPGMWAAGLLGASLQGWAVPPSAPPNAGEILRTVPALPAPPASSGTGALPEAPQYRSPLREKAGFRVKIKRIVITGNTAFGGETLLPLVHDAVGKELDLGELNALAARITQYYRDQGYLLARAFNPRQDVTEGTLEISVLEGRYGKIRLENHSRISDAVPNRDLAPLKSGDPVQAETLERQLLLMSDLPGIAVSSTLQPGTGAGTTDLTVQVDNAAAFSGNLGLDNWGNRYTGKWRTIAAADWASPMGWGDRLSLFGMGSERGGSQFDRVSYDFPVNGAGTRAGAAYAHLTYALGLNFEPLGAHGSADISSLYLNQSLIRSRSQDTSLQVDFDHRLLHDFIDSASSSDAKSMNVINVSVNSERRDAWGVGTWGANVTGGRLTLDPLSTQVDAVAYHTAGNYAKLSASATQLWGLGGRWFAYGSFSGQLADRNLDMSEKFSMGGPTGVRAYPVGEAMSDDAWLGTLELRYALSGNVQLMGFADGGLARLNHIPLPTDTSSQRSLSGLGAGLTWTSASSLNFKTYVAWRTGDAPTSAPERRPTAWAQLNQAF